MHWIQRLDSTEPAHYSCCMLTASGRDYVDRPTHEFGAEVDCRGFPLQIPASAGEFPEKGVAGGKLLIGTYLNHHTGQQASVFQTMSGTPVNVLLPSFQTIYQNFICNPPSLHNSPYGDSIKDRRYYR